MGVGVFMRPSVAILHKSFALCTKEWLPWESKFRLLPSFFIIYRACRDPRFTFPETRRELRLAVADVARSRG